MEYDKPFKTYDELINLLIERGLIIENRDFAQMALSTLAYHDLINGYKECFAKNDRFSDGVTIEDLYELYLLDKSIQNVLFKYSLIVERSFKTKLAYVMSERFGIHQSEYLDKRNYSANAKRDKKVGAKKFSDLKKDIEFLMQNTLDNPIRHYRSKNHIPPWILLKNLYFSDSISLYQYLKDSDKLRIASQLIQMNVSDEQKKHLTQLCLHLVRRFRNQIAHSGKFITYTIRPRYGIPLSNLRDFFRALLPDNFSSVGINAYAFFLSLVLLLGHGHLTISLIQDINRIIDPFYDVMIQARMYKEFSRVSGFPLDLTFRFKAYAHSLL